MEFLSRHWKSRTLILVVMGTVVSLIMWRLEFTQWAANMNAMPHADEHGNRPPAALMMVLPFVKVLVMMTVPAALVVGIRALFRLLTRKR